MCIWGEATGDGDAVGICMPGVITSGLGEGEGFCVVTLVVEGRLALVAALFFFGAGFGLLAAFIFDMS